MALDVKEIYAWGILGCGWLGQGLCQALSQDHIRVWGSGRSKKTAGEIARNGADPIMFDAAGPRSGQSEWPRSQSLLVSWPPSAGMEAYQEAANHAQTRTEWTVLISSTSVYPGEEGVYTEEDAIRRVSPHSGQCLLDIERLFDPSRTTILRAGGLFGPLRNPRHFLRRRAPERLREAVNMVHLTDVIRAIRFSAEHHLEGAYNLVAPKPVSRGSFYHAAGACEHPVDPTELPIGRRVLADKITATGFAFTWPDAAQACRELQSQTPLP